LLSLLLEVTDSRLDCCPI